MLNIVKGISRSKTFKSKQPFPALPTFIVAANILQFAGYKHEVKELLRLLCHTTRRYFINHQQILKAFLVSLPELRKLPFFGQVEYFDPKRCIYINDTLDFLARSGGNKCTYFEWPNQEDIKKMTPKDLGKDKKVENL